MKKLLLLATIILLATKAESQIEKEFTFDSNFVTVTKYGTLITSDEYGMAEKYMIFDEASSSVKIYNLDYSLYKTTRLTGLDSDYKLYIFHQAATNLINDDPLIEFIITFNKPGEVKYKTCIFNENGSLLKTFEDVYYIVPVLTSDRKFKLIGRNADMKTYSMFSLPTSLPSGIEAVNKSNPAANPYPNPAQSVISIPCQLRQGETATLRIYDMSGKLIDRKTIDDRFGVIDLNVAGYAKGSYLYEFNGIKNRFIVE